MAIKDYISREYFRMNEGSMAGELNEVTYACINRFNPVMIRYKIYHTIAYLSHTLSSGRYKTVSNSSR